jgi:L-ascorbate metabolism protein UlaG (beta-lactamase superfamily)
MRVDWYGQSAFHLTAPQATVFIDPFADMSELVERRGLVFDYPAIEGVTADLVLVTHEHLDHNGVAGIEGTPAVLRSTAGRLASDRIGEVVAVASEHDTQAGTERGPNTIFVFTLDRLRVAHFGDFGQASLREEQAAAIGRLDLAFIPVGAGPTIGPEQAREICDRLKPRWIVPMHYRTPRIGFLDPVEPFLDTMPAVHRLKETSFDTDELPGQDGPLVVVPSTP